VNGKYSNCSTYRKSVDAPKGNEKPLNKLRFNVLVMYGEVNEAICLAKYHKILYLSNQCRNCWLSEEAAELLLMYNKVEDAVDITLEKGNLDPTEALKFVETVPDLVGKFLVCLKSVDESDQGRYCIVLSFLMIRALIPWLLELVYKEDEVEWPDYAFGETVEDHFEVDQVTENKIQSLLEVCAFQTARNLYDQEYTSQKAVLDSLNYFMQKEVMLQLLCIKIHQKLNWEAKKNLATFFVMRRDFHKAFYLTKHVIQSQIYVFSNL
jgi:hypothetical protein